MRTFLTRLLLLIVGIAGIAYLLDVKDRTPSGASSKSPPSSLRLGILNNQQTEVVAVSADALHREYENNEVATDNRLRGKIIEIKGKVAGINKDFTDSVYVTLETSNRFNSATVRPFESETAKMALLSKGQIVIFRCGRTQRWSGSPSLRDCILMD